MALQAPHEVAEGLPLVVVDDNHTRAEDGRDKNEEGGDNHGNRSNAEDNCRSHNSIRHRGIPSAGNAVDTAPDVVVGSIRKDVVGEGAEGHRQDRDTPRAEDDDISLEEAWSSHHAFFSSVTHEHENEAAQNSGKIAHAHAFSCP